MASPFNNRMKIQVAQCKQAPLPSHQLHTRCMDGRSSPEVLRYSGYKTSRPAPPTSFLQLGYPATFGYPDVSFHSTSMFSSLKLKSSGKTSASNRSQTPTVPGNEGDPFPFRAVGDRDEDSRGSSERGFLDHSIFGLRESLDGASSPGVESEEVPASNLLHFAVYSDRIVKALANSQKRRTTITIYPMNGTPSSPTAGARRPLLRNLTPTNSFEVFGFTMPRLHHSLPVIATFSRVSVDFSTLGTQVDAIDEVHVHSLDGNRIAKLKGWFRDPSIILTKWLNSGTSEPWPRMTLALVQPPDGIFILDVNEYSSLDNFTKINKGHALPATPVEARQQDPYFRNVMLTEVCDEEGQGWVRTWKTQVKVGGTKDLHSDIGAGESSDLTPNQLYVTTQILTELSSGDQLEIWGTKAIVLSDESCAGIDGPICIWAAINFERGVSSIVLKMGQIVREAAAASKTPHRGTLSVRNIRTCKIYKDGLSRESSSQNAVEWPTEIYISKRLEIVYMVTSMGSVYLIDLLSFKLMDKRRFNISRPCVGVVGDSRGVWVYDPKIGLHVVSINTGQEDLLREAQLRIRSRTVV